MAKVIMGRYLMPAFAPEIQDLIGKMLTVDVTKRITLEQIKEHPAFRIGYPRNYVLPTALPLPSLPDPIPADTVDPKIFKVLLDLGYLSEYDIRAELESHTTNMAKVFVHMLTSSMSLDWLPWDGQDGEEVPEDSFIVEEHDVAFASHGGNDPFHRRTSMQQLSLGSPDLFSFVQKSTWGGEALVASSEPVNNTVTVGNISTSLPRLMASVQQLLVDNSWVFFHPNDETLITRVTDANMYVIIRAIHLDVDQFSLKIEQINGTPRDGAVFVRVIEDFVETFT